MGKWQDGHLRKNKMEKILPPFKAVKVLLVDGVIVEGDACCSQLIKQDKKLLRIYAKHGVGGKRLDAYINWNSIKTITIVSKKDDQRETKEDEG